MKKPRVLLSAYACEPEKGSEPGVGWNWTRQISRFAEVWVITRANNRPAIEEGVEKEQLHNVHWVYFDLPRWARFWKRGQRGVHLYYYLWQMGAYLIGRRLHQEVGFDLVHHVTFVNYWMPSFLSLLPVPFIWGPVGGGESAPKSFYKTFSLRGKIYEYVRDLSRWLGEHDPFVRMTARSATVALATTAETGKRLRKLGVQKVEVLSQVALSEEEIEQLAVIPINTGNLFRLLSVGNILHLKGFHIGLQAFSRFTKEFPHCEYWIIGNGPERKNLERLTRRLGVSGKVRFWGALPRQEVFRKLTEVDVLVHPSLHDSGGWVCVEAMAAGRPVICLNIGGPALQVTNNTGYKIPAIFPEQVIEDIVKFLKKLVNRKDLRKNMGINARNHVIKNLSWDRKGQELKEIYITIINKLNSN